MRLVTAIVVTLLVILGVPTTVSAASIAEVVSMTPSEGHFGDRVKIICKNFDPEGTKITFNGTPAEIASVKTTSVYYIYEVLTSVPAGASSGPVLFTLQDKTIVAAGNFTVLVKPPLEGSEDGPTGRLLPPGGAPYPPPAKGQAGTPGQPVNPPNFEPGLDLPIEKPAFQIPGPPVAPTPPTPPIIIPVGPPLPIPPTIYGKDLKSENGSVIYIIDVSGSMGWDMGQYTTPDGKTATGCRLDRAKSALISSVMSLPKNFKFDLISYDCGVYLWSSTMQLATDSSKFAAEAWIMNLQPGGATGTGPGVAYGLSTFFENRLIVLLTDGAPNCGAGDESGSLSCLGAHRSMIHGNNPRKVVINVFGIGATGDFKQFCEDVASDNGGNYTDVK